MYNADLEEIINTAYPISVTALEDSYVVKTGDFVFIATHTENENDWGGEEK